MRLAPMTPFTTLCKIVGGIALLALMTGCFKFEAEIVIDDDGSGDVEILSAIDTEGIFGILAEQDIPEEMVGDTATLCDDMASEMTTDMSLPPDAVVEEYEEDGFCGTITSFELEPSFDHSESLDGTFDEGFVLRKEGDDWVFDAPFDGEEVTDLEGEIPDDELFDAFFSDASFTFVVDLPGNAVDGQHNADSVDGGRFEWDIDLLSPPDRLFARTAPGGGGGGGGGLGLILGLVALLGALALGAWLFLRNRNADDAGALGNAETVTGTQASDSTFAAMPVHDTDPLSPPVAQHDSAAIRPADPANRETVAMEPTETPGAASAATSEAGTTAGELTPTWDPARNAWIVDHPQQGLLVHDAVTNEWRPAT